MLVHYILLGMHESREVSGNSCRQSVVKYPKMISPTRANEICEGCTPQRSLQEVYSIVDF